MVGLCEKVLWVMVEVLLGGRGRELMVLACSCGNKGSGWGGFLIPFCSAGRGVYRKTVGEI